MKKSIMFFTLMIVPTIALIAQDPVEPTTPPLSWGDFLSNPMVWFASFGGIALLTSFLAAFFNGLLKVVKSFHKQLLAWAVGIVILVVTDLINFGYASDFPIWLALVHGFAAGLASNGVYDVPTLKSILNSIEGWFKPKPTGKQ